MKQFKNLYLRLADRYAIPILLVTAFWQWRHTVLFAEVNGQYFEYGSLHVYASDFVAILVLGLLAIAGIQWWKRPERIPAGIWNAGLVVIGWMLLSSLWAGDWQVSLWLSVEWILWTSVMVALVSLGVSYWNKLPWLLLGGFVAGGFGIYQFLANKSLGFNWLGESVLNPQQSGIVVVIDEGVRRLRAYGLMPHPNIFSGIMMGLLVGMLAWVTKLHRGLKKWNLVVPFFVLGLVLGFSKSALLSFVVMLVGFGWVLVRNRFHQPKRVWGLMVVSLILLLAANQGLVVERFNPVSSIEVRSYNERITGLEEWKNLDASWWWGAGFGNYTQQLVDQYPDRQVWEVQPVHNAALLLVREIGLIGVGLLVWWLCLVASWLRRNPNKIVMATPFIAWLLLGVVDHWTVSLHQGYVMMFLALALIFTEVDV